LSSNGNSLRCRLLAWRIERAGVVDFGDLVIAEAEHLAQDFVGVFAEQRGTGHLARWVRQFDRVAHRSAGERSLVVRFKSYPHAPLQSLLGIEPMPAVDGKQPLLAACHNVRF
jgi:hypothetical protein